MSVCLKDTLKLFSKVTIVSIPTSNLWAPGAPHPHQYLVLSVVPAVAPLPAHWPLRPWSDSQCFSAHGSVSTKILQQAGPPGRAPWISPLLLGLESQPLPTHWLLLPQGRLHAIPLSQPETENICSSLSMPRSQAVLGERENQLTARVPLSQLWSCLSLSMPSYVQVRMDTRTLCVHRTRPRKKPCKLITMITFLGGGSAGVKDERGIYFPMCRLLLAFLKQCKF